MERRDAHAGNEQQELFQQRTTAQEADRAAYAQALRDSKPDPGLKATRAAEEKIAASQRTVAALQLAVEQAANDVAEAATRNRAAWLKDCERQLREDRQRSTRLWSSGRQRANASTDTLPCAPGCRSSRSDRSSSSSALTS